jgi:hypothetical protein
MGTAKLLKIGFTAISRMSGERSDPAVVILETQRDRIASLKAQNPELAKRAMEGIEHVLNVLKRNAEQSSARLVPTIKKDTYPK